MSSLDVDKQGTAYSNYYEAVQSGNCLPVALQIRTVYGVHGLAAQGIPILPGSRAYKILHSPDPMVRARGAIMGVRFLGNKISELENGFQVLVGDDL